MFGTVYSQTSPTIPSEGNSFMPAACPQNTCALVGRPPMRPRGPHYIESLYALWTDLIHHYGPATEEFFLTTSLTWTLPQNPQILFPQRTAELIRFSSSTHSILRRRQQRPISPLYTALVVHCFPILRGQYFLKAVWKYSMASPNIFHALVFASLTTKAEFCLASQYP